MTEPARRGHFAVRHPSDLLARERGAAGRVNDWAATRLSAAFGLVWTVWLFMTIPLLVLLAPAGIRSVVFYLASGWIQLWALPLFVYVGNKLQRSADAQSDAQHQALTHIALAADEVKDAMRTALDRLDIDTRGGLADLYARLAARQDEVLERLAGPGGKR